MLTPGTWMGERYRLDERIATGGMGDVWKAEDTVLGRTVALKVLQPAMLEEPGFADRFRAEARVMATINHPGVVQVYDYGESALDGGGKVAYLVMEYVEGEPLHHVLGRVGRLAPQRVMDLTAQAADALQAAHDRGIIHRDVKPGNLLVRPNGKLVLTDFGIARSAMTGNLTQVGAVLGTASYVSPEQATGTGNITPASDVYSLGVVAYQCLAGRRPFEGDNPIEVAMKHVRDEPPPLPPDVPDNVRAMVSRAMAKDVAARWPDATTMGEAARAAAAGAALPGGAAATAAFASPTPVSPATPGTAVMPAVGGTQPHAGQYSRGAATVPAASQTEEYPGYGQYGGDSGGGGYPPGGGYPGGRQPKQPKRRRGLVLGVVAGVLVLLVGLGLIFWLVNQGGGGQPRNDKGTHAADTVAINEADYLHKPKDEVKKALENKGLKVREEERTRDGFDTNEVTGVEPNGQVKRGSTVTVYFQPEASGGDLPTMPGLPGDDNTGGNTGGNTENPSQPPPSTEPPSTPASPSASPSVASFSGGSFNTGTTTYDSQKDARG
jgi:serine/threonine-protein kinase